MLRRSEAPTNLHCVVNDSVKNIRRVIGRWNPEGSTHANSSIVKELVSATLMLDEIRGFGRMVTLCYVYNDYISYADS